MNDVKVADAAFVAKQTYIDGVADPETLLAAENERLRTAAEDEITSAVQEDTKAWYAVYAPMKRVADDKLFLPDYKSLSMWVTVLSNKIHRNESLLWRYYNVGRFYDDYVTEQERTGAKYTPTDKCKISANTLRLISSVAGTNMKETCKLIRQAEEGKVSTRELEVRKRDMGRRHPANGYTARQAKEHAAEAAGSDTGTDPATAVTAVAIKVALSQKPVRLGGGRVGNYAGDHWVIQYREKVSNPELDIGQIETLYGRPKYTLLTEFPVATGTTNKPRQIDGVAIESFTAGRGAVAVHGIEIKVSKYDLQRDEKMGDYAQYVDYMWICVPKDLLSVVDEVVDPSWGVLVAVPHEPGSDAVSVSVNRLPERTFGTEVEETLRTAVRRLI